MNKKITLIADNNTLSIMDSDDGEFLIQMGEDKELGGDAMTLQLAELEELISEIQRILDHHKKQSAER